MGIRKQFLKSKPVCKVTFKLDKAFVGNAKRVQLLGDFNNWDENAAAMTQLKTGGFTSTIDVPKDTTIECRYLLDGTTWLNETEADGLVPNCFGDENFIISTKA